MWALKCQYHGLTLPIFFHLFPPASFSLFHSLFPHPLKTHYVPALYEAVEQGVMKARPCPREAGGMEAVTGKHIDDCTAQIRIDSLIG